MAPVTATALKNSPADVLDQVAASGAVAITRHDKPKAVLLSIAQFEQLTAGTDDWLDELHGEFQGMLEEMQDPKQREAARRAFNATPEELAQTAVAAAKRRSSRGA